MADYCLNNHPTPTSAHRTTSGGCIQCHRERNKQLRLKHRAALDVVQVFEAAGVCFQRDGVPVAAEEVARQMVERFPID